MLFYITKTHGIEKAENDDTHNGDFSILKCLRLESPAFCHGIF